MSDEFDRDIASKVDALADRSDLADKTYAALEATGRLAKQRALTYRCPSRCLLLEVIPTRLGLLLHVPRYKLSPRLNAEASSAAGRAKNTEDGDRHWKARSFFEDTALGLSVSCDHVRSVVVGLEDIHADLDAGATEVRWPR